MKNNHWYLCLLTLILLTACQFNQRNSSASPKIMEIRTYCEGVALANADNGLWGFVDEQQQWVIEPQYRYASDFSDSVAIVSYTPEFSFDIINHSGKHLAQIAVNGIRIQEHFHDGTLIYQDLQHGGYGLLDKQGNILLSAKASQKQPSALKELLAKMNAPIEQKSSGKTPIMAQVSPRGRMNQVMYWLYESAKIAAAQPADSTFREVILHYTECLRTAYEVKDIDFINQVFSEDALIIVGKVIQQQKEDGFLNVRQVEYNLRSKKQYLEQLAKVFAANEHISLSFNQQKVVQHPTKQGFYGVTLKQGYRSDSYADEGYLFLLWDFRNPEQPQIHVRTWQPAMMDINTPLPESQVFNFSDFTLE